MPPTVNYINPHWNAKPAIICAIIALVGVGGLVGMAKYYERKPAPPSANKSPDSPKPSAEKPYEPLSKSPAPRKFDKVVMSTDDEGTAIGLMELIAGYPGEAQSRREGKKVIVEYSGAIAVNREAYARRLAEFRTKHADRITGWSESTEEP
ncbi:MAG: hypothetical protein FD180_3066 [Planctomycetota bacterium]|nr:MAG: hypothetical protein FD180_3066 [Planctomycetota bacterium]